jgi:uncharacterized delta-60 repeat protein
MFPPSTFLQRARRRRTRPLPSRLALLFLLLLIPAAAASAGGPKVEKPGKLKLDRLFGGRVLSGPFVMDVQTNADSSILIATSNLGFRGPSGASVAKLTPELEPDPTFGGDGVVGPTELGAADRQTSSASALIVLDDGRILIAGKTGRTGAKAPLYVSRLLADGSPDPSFGDAGVRLLSPSPRRTQSRHDALALQPDGSIVFGFDLRGDGEPQLGLTRLSPDGDVDPNFGTNGVSLIPSKLLEPALLRDVPAYNSSAVNGYDVAADSEGRLAVVSSVRIKNPKLFAEAPVVVRLDADGALARKPATVLDRLPKRNGDWTSHATTLEFDSSDRIVVGGGAGFFPAGREGRSYKDRGFFAFHRLKPSGRLDRSFGKRGQTLIQVRPGDYETGAADLTIARGKILAAGEYAGETGAGYLGSTAVARIRRNGKPDRKFGERGIVLLNPNQDDGRAVAIDPEGRIIAAGTARLARLR